MRRLAWVLSCSALVGCGTEVFGPARIARPYVNVTSVDANLTNVLAASITATLVRADSARVSYHIVGATGDSVTPAIDANDTLQLPVYGLLAGQAYAFRVIAYGAGGTTTSDSVTLTTGALPLDLPSFTTTGTSSANGYVVFSSGKYGLVIDYTGRVVWYHAFEPSGPGLNFIAQSNGRYAAQPPAPGATPVWHEIAPSGELTRTFGCTRGLAPRFHDLIRETDDSYWIICDDVRTVDLSGIGGNAAAKVTAAEIQQIGANGILQFSWSAFDYLDITDLDPASRGGAVVNWTHANAIALNDDGTLVVSFRNLNEIIAINTSTGSIDWRLGGMRDDYGLAACCGTLFSRQHGVRFTADGNVVLLDNSGTPGDSRVRRYSLDVAQRQAQSRGAFSATPPVVAGVGGSVQELPSGNILAAFGDGARVEEINANGDVVWRIDGNPGYVFRAQRIASLYAPGVGTSR
ncbi:MAG TPA: arylsulfotransferase family protein [Gemmatimonadaceae bacterium]|nr:arylsulfotransferase family protein [Gemmatimonadaceae bacterium]